jgi:hypothetical protein
MCFFSPFFCINSETNDNGISASFLRSSYSGDGQMLGTQRRYHGDALLRCNDAIVIQYEIFGHVLMITQNLEIAEL